MHSAEANPTCLKIAPGGKIENLLYFDPESLIRRIIWRFSIPPLVSIRSRRWPRYIKGPNKIIHVPGQCIQNEVGW